MSLSMPLFFCVITMSCYIMLKLWKSVASFTDHFNVYVSRGHSARHDRSGWCSRPNYLSWIKLTFHLVIFQFAGYFQKMKTEADFSKCLFIFSYIKISVQQLILTSSIYLQTNYLSNIFLRWLIVRCSCNNLV